MKTIEDTKSVQFQSLYQITVEDIRYAKNRQWSVIYYSLLTFAAITGFYLSTKEQVFDYTSLAPKLALLIPAFGISIFAMWLLMETQKCLCEYRMRLEAIGSKLPEYKSLMDISSGRNKKKRHSYSRYFWDLVFPFIILIVVGTLYMTWLLFGKALDSLLRGLFLVTLAEAIFFFFFYECNTCKVKQAKEKLNQYLKGNTNDRKTE